MPLFSKKERPKLTRLFFATDLHASQRTFRKFINAGKFYDVNVLVMGGDVLGKLTVPIIRGKWEVSRELYGPNRLYRDAYGTRKIAGTAWTAGLLFQGDGRGRISRAGE